MVQKAILRQICAAAALSLVVACQSAPGAPRAADASANRETPVYRLGSGDELRITVFGQSDLTGQFEIDGSGSIAMPLVGEVPAASLTVRELEDAIKARLADGYLRDPRVSAEVANYRPYYILGEVNRPGEYPYTSGLTVQNAVAAAGGYTYRANQRVVFIKALEDDRELNYQLSPQIQVQPGDTIRIGERLF